MMKQSTINKSKYFDNRFILKLFGQINHDYLKIDDDRNLSIIKTQLDKFENKGQISEWKFELDQIYNQETNFEEIYENEIENNDFIINLTFEKTYRNIIFIGEKNDSLLEQPYISFIKNCVNSSLNPNDEQIQNNLQNKQTTISYFELTKSTLYDFFNGNKKFSQKMNYYTDDIICEEITQADINNSPENLAKILDVFKPKILNSSKYQNFKLNSQNESSTEILTLKIYDMNSNCFSKINFILFKAYKLSRDEYGHFKLFTKDNYNFFNAAQNKINIRCSYLMKVIRDVFFYGKNLFVFILPCELEFIILIHDMLNYIKIRKLIVTNFDLDDEDLYNDEINSLTNGMNQLNLNKINSESKLDKIGNMNNNFGVINNNSYMKNSEGINNENFNTENIKMNNSNNDLISGLNNDYPVLNESLNDTRMTGIESSILSSFQREKRSINFERLKLIENKDQIASLFDVMDKI